MRGPDRQQAAVGDDAVEGGAGEREVGVDGLRRVGCDVDQVGADGLDVAADDRAGEGGVALAQRVVEGGVEQRAQGVGGVVATGGGQHLHRLGHEGDEVVGAVGETCVVERALVLGDPHRAATEVGDELLGDGPLRLAGGDAEDAPRSRGRSTSVPVKVIAGCRAIGRAPTAAASAEHGEPVGAAGVDDELTLADRAARGQHRDDVGQHVVGDGEEQQVGGTRSIAGLVTGTPGSRDSMRPREASDSPAAATISWPAARSAAARTAPTRPAPTTPTRN